MYFWQIAFGIELLAVVLGFFLWFKAARAEAGPKKLGKIVAIIIIILAVLMMACTLAKAIIYGGQGGMWGGHGPCYMSGPGEGYGPGGWRCPKCGTVMGGPGMMGPGYYGMTGKGKGMGPGMTGKLTCPGMVGTAAGTAEKTEGK
jgi:hypothetical protein